MASGRSRGGVRRVPKKSKSQSSTGSSKSGSSKQAGSKERGAKRKGAAKASKAKAELEADSAADPRSSVETEGEVLQEWLEDHVPSGAAPAKKSSERSVSAEPSSKGESSKAPSNEGEPPYGQRLELGLAERYLVDRAVARALRPAALVGVLLIALAYFWGRGLQQDRSETERLADRVDVHAVQVKSSYSNVRSLVNSVESSRREVERLQQEIARLADRTSVDRERAAEEREAAERALAQTREQVAQAAAHAQNSEGQYVAVQALVERQAEGTAELNALEGRAQGTVDALAGLLDASLTERQRLAEQLSTELVTDGRLSAAVAAQLAPYWDQSAAPWTARISELEVALANAPIELRQVAVRLRWSAAAEDREATLALAVRPAGASEFLPLGESTFGAPSTYLIELVPTDSGTLLGAPWWTMEPTGAERTPDFERLAWTPIERDGARLARLEAALASPTTSGEIEFQWFALVDRRAQVAAPTE